MTDRIYRAFVGVLLLVGLYLDQEPLLLGLVAVMFLEGLTNLRLPLLVGRLAGRGGDASADGGGAIMAMSHRFDFEAERAWRLVVPVMLLLSLYPLREFLWFFPWFMGFAILGAGLSDVCPVLILLRYLGFR